MDNVEAFVTIILTIQSAQLMWLIQIERRLSKLEGYIKALGRWLNSERA